MHYLQGCKFINVTPPVAINDNAAYTTAIVDTKGFREATFLISFGVMDIAVAALKLTESDASNMASATDVPSADFSVSPLTLPSATDDGTQSAIFVNLMGRKRYLDLTFTAGDGSAGTFAVVTCILSRAEQMPDTATKRGLSQQAFA